MVAAGDETLENYLGNQIADALAGIAAFLAKDSYPVRAFLSRNAAVAFCAAMRLAYIEADAIKARQNRSSWQIFFAAEPLSWGATNATLHE